MAVPWNRILDIAVAVGRRIFDRDRLSIVFVRDQTMDTDRWMIAISNTGHRPVSLIEIHMESYKDGSWRRLDMPPFLGETLPFVLPVGANPFRVYISRHGLLETLPGAGRYYIAVLTGTGKTFRQPFQVG